MNRACSILLRTAHIARSVNVGAKARRRRIENCLSKTHGGCTSACGPPRDRPRSHAMDASRGWRGLSHGVPDRAQRIPASPPAPPDPACGEGRLYLSNALPDRAQPTPADPVSPAHKSDAPAALLAGMAVWKTSNTLPDRAQRTHAGPATKSDPTQAPTESVANPRSQGVPQILGADPATAGFRRSDSQILARVVSLL